MPDVHSSTKSSQTEHNLLFKQQYSSDEYDSNKASEQGEEENDKKKLSILQVFGYSSVLENLIQHIEILLTLGGKPSVPIDLVYKTIDEKFGPNEFQRNLFDTPSTETATLKFQKNIEHVEKILIELNQEITTSKDITNFLVALQKYDQSEHGCQRLLDEAKLNREKLQMLQHLLVTSKCKMREKLHAKSQEFEKIATEYKDMIYEIKIKESYLGSWEDSRTYQNNFRVGRKEEKLQEDVDSTLADTRNETRIHSEIEYYENALQTEYAELIEKWTGNYARDLENNEVSIQILKQKRTDQLETLDNLRNEYNKREQEMQDYIEAREFRLEEEEKMRKMNAAAVKIQAWWRRLMYRLCLGPYRKKGKNKKKKK